MAFHGKGVDDPSKFLEGMSLKKSGREKAVFQGEEKVNRGLIRARRVPVLVSWVLTTKGLAEEEVARVQLLPEGVSH